MSKRRAPAPPPQVLALLDEARKVAASGSAPRKHHVVPASYLERWAEGNQLRVTDVRGRNDFVTSPRRAGKETDFYSLATDDVDPDELPPLLFEVLLGKFEGWAAEGIRHLLSEPAEPDPEVLARFAWHLGMSHTRGPGTRRRLRRMAEESVRLQYRDITRDGVQEILRRDGTEPTDEQVGDAMSVMDDLRTRALVARPPDPALIGLAAETAVLAGEELLRRRWTIFKTPPILVTTDEPILVIGGPGHARHEVAGIQTAGVVVYPLAPDSALVMFHPQLAVELDIPPEPLPVGDLDHVQTSELNRELGMACERWIFERPSKRVGPNLRVPEEPGTTVIEDRPDLEARDRDGDIVRVFGTTRWQGALSSTPWPVAAWWP